MEDFVHPIGGLGPIAGIKSNLKFALCLGLGMWMTGGVLQPVAAFEGKAADNTVGALAEFVQTIKIAQPTSSSLKTFEPTSPDISALTQFAQEVGADRFQVAQAGNPWDVAKSAPKAKAYDGEATIVGSKVCLGCHASQTAAFEQTLMGRVGKVQKGKMECENCHGPGSAHVKAGGGRGVGGIISFRDNDRSRSVDANNAICLSCHENGQRTYWNGSPHETRGVACTNCHQVMKRTAARFQMKQETEAGTCFQCHKDRQAQMLNSSHMPMREGKMTCSDCHNPHGSFTEALLKFNSVNDTCYRCHADKRGPFLWEHYPVRDNCSNCHRAHGSNNEFMLKMMIPRLCQQCHTADHGPNIQGNPFSALTMNRSCLNCHSKIHGSNAPGGVLFHR